MERLVELVQRRARERAERFVGRTMEVLVEGPSRTDPAACAAAAGTTRPSTSTGPPPPASWSRSRSADATSTTLSGSERLLSRAA